MQATLLPVAAVCLRIGLSAQEQLTVTVTPIAYLGVDCLRQVRAILTESTALNNLVAEVQQVQSLINTVCVKGVAPELLQFSTRTKRRRITVSTPRCWCWLNRLLAAAMALTAIPKHLLAAQSCTLCPACAA